MSATESAWVAGLLEGEGTFTFKRSQSPFVRVVMTDRDVIHRLSAITGVGRVVSIMPRASHHKLTWAWTVQARDHIATLLLQVSPLMHERRRSAIMRQLDALNGSPPARAKLSRSSASDAWLAGLLEGEMHVGARPKDVRARRLQVTSIELDVLETARRVSGTLGAIHEIAPRKPTHKHSYRWEVSSIREVISVLTQIRPWLLSRRSTVADEILRKSAYHLAGARR